MIRNYLIITLRHLSRQKLNTALHVAGLTIGMSVCLLIGLFLRYELSFDGYHDKAARTYRINSIWVDNGKKNYHFSTPAPMADAIRTEISGLEHVCSIDPSSRSMIEINPAKRFMQEHVMMADVNFLDVFHVEVIRGNAFEALRQPFQALLTESTAKKFFGNEDPMGKTFKFKNEFNITVAGLIKDLPANTHLPASMILSYVPNERYMGRGMDGWTNVSGTTTYVVLPENYDMKILEAGLKKIADKNINSDPRMPKFVRSDFDVQPLSDVHFNTRYAGGGEWVKATNKSWLWVFAAIGLAVLALACINFVNLSTAQAMTRAKEVGVRKSVGAGRANLMGQFLGEAWLLAVVSGVLAVAVAQASLPHMNTLLEKGVEFDIRNSAGMMATLLAGIFLTGLFAGMYPAWVIAKFNPAASLKTGMTVAGDRGSSFLRKGLVVTQFIISAGLLIAVMLIAEQVKFLRTMNLGFDKENVLNVELDGAGKAPAFAAELARIPGVKDVSFATATPSNDDHWGTMMSANGRDDRDRLPVTLILADHNFVKMYGMELMAGRMPEASDTNYVSQKVPQEKQMMQGIANEKLVRALGFESNAAAIGKRFWIGIGSGHTEIVGVVKDFNTGSLHEAIKPTLITPLADVYNQAGIKIEAKSNLPETVAAIESAWKKVNPDGVFSFKFLDSQIDSFYRAEKRLYDLFKIFAGLAMLISCLGLWGLTTFAAQQRTKEIGIRKVLGASVNAIVVLLSRDFLLLVVIALAVASPLVYFFMKDWLTSFAFRIDIGWPVFAIAGAASVCIALFTVSFQAIRAALSNPVDSLRNE